MLVYFSTKKLLGDFWFPKSLEFWLRLFLVYSNTKNKPLQTSASPIKVKGNSVFIGEGTSGMASVREEGAIRGKRREERGDGRAQSSAAVGGGEGGACFSHT